MMKLAKIAFNLILIIGIVVTFFSCKGQNNPQSSKVSKTIEAKKSPTKFDTTIWSIYQDKKSNFWFGSRENGVFYYDGNHLKQITTEDGLVSNEIRGIQEDSLGNIFFETTQGISKFDGQSFQTLEIKEGDDSANEWKLEPDDLWFRIDFNKNGVYRFDGEFLHYLKFPKAPQEDEFYRKTKNTSLKPYGLYSIYKDSKGTMWFGTSSLGVCRFDGKMINWHYEDQLQTTASGGDFGTRAIIEDKDEFFWINNTRFRYEILASNTIDLNYKKEAGISVLNEDNQTEYPFFLSIEKDNEGDLWMVTYDDGVWRNNGKELIHYPVKNGGTDVLLFSIYKDNEGDLWLGTFNAGAYKFNGESFEKFDFSMH